MAIRIGSIFTAVSGIFSLQLIAAGVFAVGVATVGLGSVQAETRKDDLVVARNLDGIISLDPAEAFEVGSGEIVRNLYARLLVPDPADGSKLLPELAESWTVAPDGSRITFAINAKAKFASGRPVTGEDVAFSLRRAVVLAKSPAFILTQFGWTKDNVADAVKSDGERGVELEIRAPRAPSLVLNALTTGVAAVVEKAEVEAHQKDGDLGNGWLRSAGSAGAGGYVLQEWRPKEVVVLKANPHFFAGPPPIGRVIFRHVPESATQRLLLEKGDVDIARDLTPDQIRQLGGHADFKVWISPKQLVIYLGLNQKNPILANPKIWEAFRWAIDYDGIANNVLAGQYSVHQSYLGHGSSAALDTKPYKLDLDKAKALVAEAGYPNGFSVTIDAANSAPYLPVAESLQATLRKIGITADIQQADLKQVLTKYRARNHDLVVIYWGEDYNDPHSSSDFFVRNPDNGPDAKVKTLPWRNSWDIPDLTAAADAAAIETDPDKRRAAYLKLQERIQTASPLIVAFQQTEQTVSRRAVSGYISGNWTPTYWRVTKD